MDYNQALDFYRNQLNLQNQQFQQQLQQFTQSQTEHTSFGSIVTPENLLHKYGLPVPQLAYDMVVKLNKDCWYCEHTMTCPVTKPSHIASVCGVGHLKQAVLQAGILYIRVMKRHTGDLYFPVYKNKMLVGELPNQKENQKLIKDLEKCKGYGVLLYTKLHKELSYSTYTILRAGIAGCTIKKVLD